MLIQIPSAHTSPFKSLVFLWVRMYSVRYNGNKKSIKKRLEELQTWDKPLEPIDNDPNGKHKEHAAKIEALKYFLD